METITRVISQVSRVLAYLAAACTVLMMVVILVDLGYRTLRGGSLVGAYEGVVMLIACVVFLGLPYAELSGTAVRVTLLTERLRPRAAAATRLGSTLFATCIMLWLTFASWSGLNGSVASGDYMAGLIHFPTWPMRLAIAVGVTMLSLVFLQKMAVGIVELAVRPVATTDSPTSKERMS